MGVTHLDGHRGQLSGAMGPPAGPHDCRGHGGGSAGLIQFLDTPPRRPQGCRRISGTKACVTHTSPFTGN